jgi:hypothetical protein
MESDLKPLTQPFIGYAVFTVRIGPVIDSICYRVLIQLVVVAPVLDIRLQFLSMTRTRTL